MKRKIILVDDQLVYRQSLRAVLGMVADINIIGEASNGEEFLNMLLYKKPEIVFMDIEMPIMNGIEATKKAVQNYPNLTIIGLSMYDNKSYVDKLIGAGAKGYLLKSCDNYDLFKTIIKHPDAEIFFSENLRYKPNVKKNSISTILIVDDFETNIIVMKSSLKIAGFKVLSTKNPFIALKMLKDNVGKIDLIVTDYKMPVMNGAELCLRIKQIPKYSKTPVLMLSNETSRKAKIEAKKAGATGWIKKPFQIDKFLRIIEKAL